jgi:transcriptional regulator with XRE-family HTH domain
VIGRFNATASAKAVINHLTMLRQLHNATHPDAPVYGRDVAEYIGLRSKSTMVHYENHKTIPSLAVLEKWAEFWGLELYWRPIPEKGNEDG